MVGVPEWGYQSYNYYRDKVEELRQELADAKKKIPGPNMEADLNWQVVEARANLNERMSVLRRWWPMLFLSGGVATWVWFPPIPAGAVWVLFVLSVVGVISSAVAIFDNGPTLHARRIELAKAEHALSQYYLDQ